MIDVLLVFIAIAMAIASVGHVIMIVRRRLALRSMYRNIAAIGEAERTRLKKDER